MVAAKKTVSSLSFSAINVLDLVVVLNSKSILMGLCFVGFDLENAEEDPWEHQQQARSCHEEWQVHPRLQDRSQVP